MKATFIQNGNMIDYTPSADVAAGDVVLFGSVLGVAIQPIAANELGSLAITGVFEVEKAASEEITAGTVVYWDNTDKVITSSASGNTMVGYAVATSATTATTVRIALNAAFGTYGVAATATAAGIVELATSAETLTGTDTARAVTPAGVKAAVDAIGMDDLVTAASNIADLTLTSVTGEAGSEVIDLGTENANLKADLIAIKTKINAILASLIAAGIVADSE